MLNLAPTTARAIFIVTLTRFVINLQVSIYYFEKCSRNDATENKYEFLLWAIASFFHFPPLF
jgi:hypothetical protein